MTATSAASTDSRWIPIVGAVDGLRVGLDVVVSTVTLDPVRVANFRDSIAAAVGSDAAAPPCIADICPDPLVFALASGLRRARILDRAIDGGSEWIDLAPVPDGQLYAVSRVSAIEERTTSRGRRTIRVIYETTFTSLRGAAIGIARGISIHAESDA